MLTVSSAQNLLAPITGSPVIDIQHISNTNDVYKVLTGERENFFVKFHTSSWYKDAPDTFVVVQREAAAHAMLRRKGIPLAYRTWTDCTRRFVNRSVLITSELPGTPVPTALTDYPGEQEQIIVALGRFLKSLYDLTFPRAGYIELSGDADLPFSLDPGENAWWNTHPCHRSENFKALAFGILAEKENLLPTNLFSRLKDRFEKIPQILAPEYSPPRFVINNFHPFHIHTIKDSSGWRITGIYDFEAASSGTPLHDLVGNELQLAPVMGNLDWRKSFYEAYGHYPDLEAYKTVLLCFLLRNVGAQAGSEVPDPAWLLRQLPLLMDAAGYDSLCWYPGSTGKSQDGVTVEGYGKG